MGKFDKEIPPFGGLLDFFFYSTVENPGVKNPSGVVIAEKFSKIFKDTASVWRGRENGRFSQNFVKIFTVYAAFPLVFSHLLCYDKLCMYYAFKRIFGTEIRKQEVISGNECYKGKYRKSTGSSHD